MLCNVIDWTQLNWTTRPLPAGVCRSRPHWFLPLLDIRAACHPSNPSLSRHGNWASLVLEKYRGADGVAPAFRNVLPTCEGKDRALILTGPEITKQCASGRIAISPFREDQVNPNSYDLRLGETIGQYQADILDTRSRNPFETVSMPASGFTLRADRLYLGHSDEVIGSEHYVPLLHAKSGIARLGLFVHVTADLIDIGSIGQVTFQLFPTSDLVVYPQMRIGQVSFWQPYGEVTLYDGKYQGSQGPQPSQSYKSTEIQ